MKRARDNHNAVAQGVTLKGLSLAFVTVTLFLGIIGWLFYSIHFTSPDSWQHKIFSGTNGENAILWMVFTLSPFVALRVTRLRRSGKQKDFPLAAASEIGRAAAAIGLIGGQILSVSNAIRHTCTALLLGGILLHGACRFVLDRRAGQAPPPTPKNGATSDGKRKIAAGKELERANDTLSRAMDRPETVYAIVGLFIFPFLIFAHEKMGGWPQSPLGWLLLAGTLCIAGPGVFLALRTIDSLAAMAPVRSRHRARMMVGIILLPLTLWVFVQIFAWLNDAFA